LKGAREKERERERERERDLSPAFERARNKERGRETKRERERETRVSLAFEPDLQDLNDTAGSCPLLADLPVGSVPSRFQATKKQLEGV
jgi:hypothetical protein